MVMLMVVIRDDTPTQALSPLSDFLFLLSFPHLSQCQSTQHITNLHIFLSLSCSFLLVSGWRPSYSCFLIPWMNQNVGLHCQKWREFYDLKKSGAFGFLNRILWGKGSALNPHKTGTNEIRNWIAFTVKKKLQVVVESLKTWMSRCPTILSRMLLG